MRELREAGWSDAAIGRQFEMSRQRVGKILGRRTEPVDPVKKEALLAEARRRVFLLNEDREKVQADLGLNNTDMRARLGGRWKYYRSLGLMHCRGCKRFLPPEDFSPKSYLCKPCASEYAKQFYWRKKAEEQGQQDEGRAGEEG